MMNILSTSTVLSLCFWTLLAAPTPDVNCGGKAADIVFLVDTSSSIGRRNFKNYVRPFLSNVTDSFDIGPGSSQTRVGVVTFSDLHKLEFNLGEFLNKDELKDQIMSIPINGGNTNTGESLTYVAEQMFKEERGSRSNVAHIIIILTDGASQNYRATQLAAENTHNMGLLVFAIGVGSQIDSEELGHLASDPDVDFMFRVDNFEALKKIKTRLALKTCEVTTVRATNAPSTSPMSTTTTSVSTRTTSPSMLTTPDFLSEALMSDDEIRFTACGGKPAEVYFILDSSGSIEKSDFSIETLNFVKNVSNMFDIGAAPSQTRVGIINFSDNVNQIFPLDAHTSREELLAAISPDNVPHKAQGTNTADALRFVTEKGFGSKVARQNVAHVAIIITDGQSENLEATKEAALAARRSGTYIFAIGVGKSADHQELKDISSDPDSRFVFTVRDYAALREISRLLAIRTCRVEEQAGHLQYKDQAVCGMDGAELVFVYDSFSMGLKATRIISTEASEIAKTLNSRVGSLSVGMVSEACPSDINIPRRSAATFSRQSLMVRDSISSELAPIMKDARRKFFSAKKSGRQVMVLFVDEASMENLQDVIGQKRYLQFKGMEVVVVVMGEVNSKQVEKLASSEAGDHVVHVPNAHHLPKVRNLITDTLCGGESLTTTTATTSSSSSTTTTESAQTPFLPIRDLS